MEEEKLFVSNKHPLKRKSITRVIIATFLLLLIISFTLYNYMSSPSIDADTQTFEIEKGMTVKAIAEKAGREKIVRSELLLYTVLTLFHDPTSIHAGTYLFTKEDDVYSVARKLSDKEVEQDLVRITIPEGMNVNKVAVVASDLLPEFDENEYLEEALEIEGYLFPETYFVPESFTASDLVTLQQATYEDNIKPLRQAIDQSNFTEYEVLILASIIEREANDEESMRMVSGILQNRLDIGMALQADATIEYVLDTPLDELPEGQLATELREKDSPYNTYLNKGLPPTPIGNPGLQSITAVLEPTPSEYFYYITDTNGDFYYAKTLSEHNTNVNKYLR